MSPFFSLSGRLRYYQLPLLLRGWPARRQYRKNNPSTRIKGAEPVFARSNGEDCYSVDHGDTAVRALTTSTHWRQTRWHTNRRIEHFLFGACAFRTRAAMFGISSFVECAATCWALCCCGSSSACLRFYLSVRITFGDRDVLPVCR